MAQAQASSEARWSDALDAMERAARGVEHIVAGSDYQPCAIPDDLGPLPDTLRDRAFEVSATLESGIATAGSRLGAIRTELARLEPTRRTRATPGGRGTFETHA
jgi:hypothetical protein